MMMMASTILPHVFLNTFSRGRAREAPLLGFCCSDLVITSGCVLIWFHKAWEWTGMLTQECTEISTNETIWLEMNLSFGGLKSLTEMILQFKSILILLKQDLLVYADFSANTFFVVHLSSNNRHKLCFFWCEKTVWVFSQFFMTYFWHFMPLFRLCEVGERGGRSAMSLNTNSVSFIMKFKQ